MPTASRSLIAPTANALLERALRDKLARRSAEAGSLGELEPLALRLGLMQNSLKPQLHDPQLVLIASDHGLAVDGIVIQPGHSTADEVQRILAARAPLAVFAAIQGLSLTVVDAGVADRLARHERLLVRKIAHGTRSPRVTAAMSVEQAHAALRAGLEISDTLPGNAVACAGLGVGGEVSAALVLARLGGTAVRDLVFGLPSAGTSEQARMLVLAQSAQNRHRAVSDPIEVLAAFGGFEIAMLTGLMLGAAQRRHLVLVDGLQACAALMVASRIADAVTDYCVFCRSRQHHGLDEAIKLFRASALLELGLNSTDGAGAALAWPLLRSAAALLTEVAEGDDAGPTLPSSGFVDLSMGSAEAAHHADLLEALTTSPPSAPSTLIETTLSPTPEASPATPTPPPSVSTPWQTPFEDAGGLAQPDQLHTSESVDTTRDMIQPR